MRKVFFINSWNEPHSELLKRYSKQTPKCSGVWKEVVGVSNIKDADYYIVLGGHYLFSNLDPDKTIYLKREPDYIEKAPHGYKHSILWKDTHCGITWWVNKNYDELKQLSYSKKQKKISCIVSAKHHHRVSFVNRMMNNNDVVELFGRGHTPYNYGEQYKGELNYDGKCKFLGLRDYDYTIVLENSQEINYWTEKLADAYLSWCIPVYWGCPNLNKYFDPQSYRTIDLNDTNPLGTIREMLERPITSDDIELLSMNRNKILDEYNIWEVIRKKILKLEQQ